jgi:hypothetical protein
MTNRAVEQFDDAKSRMADDFKTMIADGEELMKAAASVSGGALRWRGRSSRTS